MDRKYNNRLEDEIYIKVHSFAKYYPGRVSVFIPNEPQAIRQSGWELRTSEFESNKQVKKPMEDAYETNLERSVRRSAKLVSDLLLCNSFEMFVTITFAEDRYDIHAKKKQFATWLKNQRDRNGSFSYVFVPEFHKDGALHFHGTLKGYTGKVKQSFSSKTGKPLMGYKMKPVYELPEFKSGFSRVEYYNGKDRHERDAIRSYITKYITKDMISIAGKKRFWVSQKLNRPLTEFNPEWWRNAIPSLVHKGDFGEFRVYTAIDNLPSDVLKLISGEHL